MFESIHDGNFLLYAARYYNNPQCFDTIEFYDDLNRFKYLKRLFNKYVENDELRERLILNHIVVLYNIFGIEAATRMLFLKLQGYEQYLKPFLLYLNYMPDVVVGIGIEAKDTRSIDIPMDQNIIEALRRI